MPNVALKAAIRVQTNIVQAEWSNDLITEYLGEPDAVRRLILAGGEVRRFHDPSRTYLHSEDVEIALDIDRYDFAIRVEFEDGRPVAHMERPA